MLHDSQKFILTTTEKCDRKKIKTIWGREILKYLSNMSKKKATATSLPLSRTAKIMTSAVGVESVDQDIVALATKATEIFLTDFARRAYELSDSNAIEYDDIQRLVHSDPRYDFLIDTTPKRIKFSDALKLREEAKRLEQSQSASQPDKPLAPSSNETPSQKTPPASPPLGTPPLGQAEISEHHPGNNNQEYDELL